MRTARVFRLSMAHPSDLSELDHLIAAGTILASEVAAIIGKTEGNGGVNDFTRGYFTQTLMALLSRHLERPASQLIHEIPCVLSGGTAFSAPLRAPLMLNTRTSLVAGLEASRKRPSAETATSG